MEVMRVGALVVAITQETNHVDKEQEHTDTNDPIEPRHVGQVLDLLLLSLLGL
jgi:hypothetical protein